MASSLRRFFSPLEPRTADTENSLSPRSTAIARRTPPTAKLTHIDSAGRATMVDVGHKPIIRRTAVAEGFFVAAPATLDLLMAGKLPKGEALAAARLAGILAAKRTDELIPLCHTLGLDQVTVDFDRVARGRLRVRATASVAARTGVEMEALVAVSVACLTLYDMAKAVDKKLRITEVVLVEKRKEEVRERTE